METAYYKLLSDVLESYDRLTPQKITHLRENQIFVFGTDRKGSQKQGAAGMAAKRFEAMPGVIEGPTGRCYALPTMGFPFESFSKAVIEFEKHIRTHKTQTFLVTPVGCGHAGFDEKKVAGLFIGMIGLTNVMLPETFIRVYRQDCAKHLGSDFSEKKDEDFFQYFDERLHDVLLYLLKKGIDFDKDGGFVLNNKDGEIIAEAELGIESEKVVFIPFDEKSENTFISNGFKVCTPEEYLSNKREER